MARHRAVEGVLARLEVERDRRRAAGLRGLAVLVDAVALYGDRVRLAVAAGVVERQRDLAGFGRQRLLVERQAVGLDGLELETRRGRGGRGGRGLRRRRGGA